MHTARIAELLEPFLRSPTTANPCHPELKTSCHSESGQRPGEEPALPSLANGHRLFSACPEQSEGTIDLERISTYIDILIRWNAHINLTAIRDPEDIVTRHFGESLFAARHLFPVGAHVGTAAPGSPAEGSSAADAAETVGGRSALVEDAAFDGRAALQSLPRARRGGRVKGQGEAGALAPVTLADLGSGAGFPGLPIKLWAPNISLTLIESNHKKTAFLREVARALTLTNVNIQNTRAETLTNTFDVVTLRAVERFEAILPTAAALLAPAARLALLISATQQDQARSTLPNLAWSDPVSIPQSRSRILLLARRPDKDSLPQHQ